MSHLTQSTVEQFFELEKESARGVLRKEMDLAMDTIFKQMKRKLMMLVDNVELGNETFNEQGLGDLQQHEQQLYSNLMPNDTNHIPSTSTNSHPQICVLNVSNLSEQGGLDDQIHHEQQLRQYSSSNQIPSTSNNSHVPDNTSNQYNEDEIVVKNELGEIVNIIQNKPIPSSSFNQPSIEQSNDNIDDLFDELDDDDEDCDCPDCVGDLFAMKEEGDDQDEDDDVQLIEDPGESNDSISRPTKRPRHENDQVQDQVQPNNQTNPNQFITISLKCSHCSQMFQDKNALNVHLKSVHSIERFRCLYKDCNGSFDARHDLTRHYSSAHQTQPNTTWPCGSCSGQFKNSYTLLTHHLMYHQDGVFQCAYPDCQFVGELRQTVRNHYYTNHKESTFYCQYVGCTKRYINSLALKIHQRTHRDVKPYRCKWPQCQYAGSAYKYHAIRHIRIHLKKVSKQNNKRINESNDPNDYLEVMQDLL